MQGAFERTDGAGDGGVHVGEGGRDDARSEGAGVELMVGVQDERDVEGAGRSVGWLGAIEHPDEVGSVREGLVRVDDGLALADAIEDGDDHGDLRGEPVGLAHVAVVGGVLLVGIVEGEQANGGTQHLHGGGVGGHAAEELDDAPVHGARGGKSGGKVRELVGRGQLAEPEEIGGLFEGGVGSELVDIDAAVREDTGVAVDPADGRRGGDNTFQTFGCDCCCHGPDLLRTMRH